MIHSLEDYVRALEQKQIVDIVHVAAAVILIYDLILTLHLEISLVWFSRWNYTKVLYLLTRYIPFATNVLIIYSHLIPNSPSTTCTRAFKAAGWSYLVGLDLAAVILMIRTWACWERNKWVGIGLALWILLCQIPSVIFMRKFLDSLRFGSPVVGMAVNSCFVVESNRLLWGNWLVSLLGEGVTLVLMAIFAYRSCRDGNNTPLIRLIYRDGLIFYVYLFCVTSINIALTLALDNGFVAMVSPAQSAIHSVLTTRIVLNIREAALQRLQDHSFDLHLSETESRSCRSQIRFADRQVVLYSSDEQMRDTFGRGEGHGDSGASIGGVEVASISTRTTISHITLPMARGAKGGGVVGQFEPGEDDDMDSINTFLDEWV